MRKRKKNGFKYPYYADELVFWLDSNNSGFEGYYSLIFSHNFAKAFWGEDKVNSVGESQDEYKERMGWITNWGYHALRWQYHLQQMVLEKEPLKYLEKFL